MDRHANGRGDWYMAVLAHERLRLIRHRDRETRPPCRPAPSTKWRGWPAGPSEGLSTWGEDGRDGGINNAESWRKPSQRGWFVDRGSLGTGQAWPSSSRPARFHHRL